MKTIQNVHATPQTGFLRMSSFPVVLCQFIVVLVAALAHPGRAEEKEFLFQKIEFKNGKWVGVGNGPFSDAYTNGVAPDDPDFSGARLDATMFEERQFGSIGAAKGGQFKNMTKKKVRDLHFTILKKGDTFKKTSRDGDDFDVSFGTDADGNSTMTLTAKEGKELNPNDVLWMKIPEGDQPGGTRKPIYKGKLTDDPPPKARAKEEKPPKAEDNGGGGGGGGGKHSKISYDSLSNSLAFQMMPMSLVEYADGTVVSNNLAEPILGCAVSVGPLQVLGPSPDMPGAIRLSDSGLTLQQGTNVLFGAALVDVLLVPDSSQPGFDSVLQGTLAWEQALGGSGSRYLYEHFYFFEEAAFFFRSSLLTATSGLLGSGQSDGTGYLTAVSGGDIPPSPARLIYPAMSNLFGFELTGESNRTYLVQDSQDLVNWLPSQYVQSGGGPIPVFDPASPGFQWRFYRAAQVPGGFDGNTWVISVFAGNGGNVTPSGNVPLSTGSSLPLVASPLPSYVVHAWFVDGFLAQTGGTTFNLSNVRSDHDVQVTFKIQ